MRKIRVPKAEVFFDNEGEPWAIFVWGHVPEKHFLACARAIAKRNSVKVAGKVEHRYIREEGDGDQPWHWCKGSQKGANPVTCIVEPELID